MGSSIKRKREKQKAFTKPKLKVGKPRPKASNITDTTFRSKGIKIMEQSLSTEAPSASALFSRSLSQVTSKSHTQRREALAHIAAALSTSYGEVPSHTVLTKLLPLWQDGYPAVRKALVAALHGLRKEDIDIHGEKTLIYVSLGMHSLNTGIRDTSMDILAWAMDLIGDILVSSAGGWIKILQDFALLFDWPLKEEEGGWSSIEDPKIDGAEHRVLVKAMNNLKTYLSFGLSQPEQIPDQLPWPCNVMQPHLIPRGIHNPYGYLNLFGPPRDVAGEMYRSQEDRRTAFNQHVEAVIVRGLDKMKQQGGDLGRVAASVEKIAVED